MPNHASEFLRAQLCMTMTEDFDRHLGSAMDRIAAAGPVDTLNTEANSPQLYKLPRLKWTPIYIKSQGKNMSDVWGAVGAAKIQGAGDWCLYWADNGSIKEMLLIGKWAGIPLQFQDYFSWKVSNTDRVIFNGDWNPPDGRDNKIDMNFQGELRYDHKGKHFGKNPSEAQYTIGKDMKTRKMIVAGMEKKSIEEGLNFGGESFFCFDVVVGTDGQKPQKESKCIRVDAPGQGTQHSHPIPENQANMVSHHGKVESAIRTFTTDRNLDDLVKLAKYLKVIGATRGEYSNLSKDARLYGHLRPPRCIYWAW